MVYPGRDDEAKTSSSHFGGRGWKKLERVCLQEVEITFFEGSKQENATNQITKKSQALWEFRAEWRDGERGEGIKRELARESQR